MYFYTPMLQALAADMAELPESLARLVVTHHWDTEAALQQCQGLPLCIIHGQQVRRLLLLSYLGRWAVQLLWDEKAVVAASIAT